MEKEILEQLKTLQEEGRVLKGTVKLVEENNNKHQNKYGTDILQLELTNGLKGIIKREDLDVRVIKQSLVPYVGKQVRFVIKEIEEDGTLICSRKEVKEAQRDELIKKLEAGEQFDAKITHIERFGAYCNIEGTSVVLRNMDFSEDHTIISDIYQVGEPIKVKLHKVASTKRILVEAVDKYCNPTSVDFDTFAPNQVVYGRIRTIRVWGCYVCIAPGLDALAPIPDDMNIEEGMTVLLRTTKVMPEERRIRGKVISIINENDDFDLDK